MTYVCQIGFLTQNLANVVEIIQKVAGRQSILEQCSQIHERCIAFQFFYRKFAKFGMIPPYKASVYLSSILRVCLCLHPSPYLISPFHLLPGLRKEAIIDFQNVYCYNHYLAFDLAWLKTCTKARLYWPDGGEALYIWYKQFKLCLCVY